MINMGLHLFDSEIAGASRGRILSTSFRDVTLKIFRSDEQMTIPVQVCTTVRDVKQALANRLGIDPDSLKFLIKQGCCVRQQNDLDEMGGVVTIRGIESFEP